MKKLTTLLFFATASATLLITSCGKDDDVPPAENEEEVIDFVTLTFTPDGGGAAITATATDPDGEGVQDLAPDNSIDLDPGTTYTLTITLENKAEGENITEEIEAEDDEHMFFFSFTNDIFGSPTGDGNVDDRADAINYNDEDGEGNPVGLSTEWTTSASETTDGAFRVILKHQPDIKTATSTADDGESDIDIEWVINITTN